MKTEALGEALKALSAAGKTTMDVRWVGRSQHPMPCGSWDDFVLLAAGGRPMFDFISFVIVGDDWWLECVQEDMWGAWWWEFQTLPVQVG